MLIEPFGRLAPDRQHLVGKVLVKAMHQQFTEQMVVAVPGARIVQRDDEHARAVNFFNDRLAVRVTGDGAAQRRGEFIQDRGHQQKLIDVLGLAREDLIHQVIGDKPVFARKVRQAAGRVWFVFKGKHGQVQTGDPTF